MRQFIISLLSNRRIRWAAAIVCLYALLGFALAPWLLEKNVKQLMAERYNSELRITKTKVNPFTLSLLISDLELDAPNGASLLKLDEFFVNFQLSSMFRKAWTFAEFRASALQLTVVREDVEEDGSSFNFSYLLPTETTPEAQPENEPDGEIIPILVYNFSIIDAGIQITDNVPVEPITTNLESINVNVQGLSTLLDQVAQQTVAISLENDGMLSESGELQLNPLLATGQINLAGVDYFPLVSQYIRNDLGLDITQGVIDIDLNYSVSAKTTNDSPALSIGVDNFNFELADLLVNTYAQATTDPLDSDLELLSLPLLQLNNASLRWPEQTLALTSVNVDNSIINIFRDETAEFSLLKLPLLNTNGDIEEISEADQTQFNSNSARPWSFSLVEFNVNQLSLNLTDESVGSEGELGVSEFNLSISDLNNAPGSRFPTTASIELISGGTLSSEGEFLVLPTPEFVFSLNVDSLALNALQPYIESIVALNVNSGMINITGDVVGSSEGILDFSGAMDVMDLSLVESVENELLASWQELRADNIAFSLESSSLEISEVKFIQPYGDVIIGEDGSLNLGRIRIGSSTENISEESESIENSVDEADLASANPWDITIGRVAIEDGAADFSDFSLPLPFSAAIAQLNGELSTIATTSTEASVVDFEGQVDEFGLLQIAGSFLPFDPKANTDISLSFENIIIPKFSAYAIPFVGREIADGRLDIDLGFKLVDSQLAGENLIILRDLQLGERVDYPDAVSLPLDLAVALLKGPDGNIDLDLPVSGDIDDPQFSYGNIAIEIFRNLIINIVTAPFSFLANLVGFEGEELEYIDFISGRADLTPPQLEKAGKLAEALVLRSELSLEVSGVVDREADGLALRESKLDSMLEDQIAQLSQGQSSEEMYAQQRRTALEGLYLETLASDTTLASLEDLQIQFSASIVDGPENVNAISDGVNVELENGVQSAIQLDELAYANEIYRILVAKQTVLEEEFSALATARANNTKMAVLANAENLQERIVLVDNQELSSEAEDVIRMKVSISVN